MRFHLLHDREDPENIYPANAIFYVTTGTYVGAGSVIHNPTPVPP
ncbi:Uncharacterised protein [Yersinia mollaretii]|jgi:hypothetical protein|nr:Uncharacterised protein [Yersinia mollaretii]